MPDSITGAQNLPLAFGLSNGQQLPRQLKATYPSYRTVRKHATVQFARAMAKAPILSAGWNYEANEDAPEGALELVEKTLENLRPIIMGSGLCGVLDFGWQAFEMIWDLDDNGNLVPIKAKPLLHDITHVLVTKKGTIDGIKQTSDQTVVPIEVTLFLHGEVEGTLWYSEGRLEVVRQIYNRWIDWDHGAARYDKKVAGSHLVISHPPGKTTQNGTDIDNSVVAKGLLNSIKSSSGIILPRWVPASTHGINKEMIEHIQWDVSLLKDSGAKQPSFLPRGEYLDKLIVRAYFLPERAILEGKFGTKADAGEHAGFALINMDIQHSDLVRLVNWHLTNRILVANYGEKAANTVKAVASPIDDEKRKLFGDTFKALLTTEGGLAEMLDRLDLDRLVEAIDIPMLDEDDREALRAARELQDAKVQEALVAANAGGTGAPGANNADGE